MPHEYRITLWRRLLAFLCRTRLIAHHKNRSERTHRSEERRHKKTPAAERKSEKKSKTGADRGSWIEDVVKNSMRDVAHRYEAQRIRKLSGPVSRGPPLVMPERARAHALYMHAGAVQAQSHQARTSYHSARRVCALFTSACASWFCLLTRVRTTRNNRCYTCETRRQCPRAGAIFRENGTQSFMKTDCLPPPKPSFPTPSVVCLAQTSESFQ